jgi:hypothetical protein
VMRGEEGSEFKARHGLSLRNLLFFGLGPNYGVRSKRAIAETADEAWLSCRPR